MTTIVVDAMGSDNYPEPDVQGAVLAARDYGVEIILAGSEPMVKPILEAQNPGNLPIRIAHAPEILEMADKPAENARRKAQNSMAVGMGLVKSGEADAFVTAGNTGGAMANALFQLGRVRGVKRPALTALFPVSTGYCVVTDIGANAECKPEYLLQFAVMGSIYAEKILGKPNPRVGLLSNGEEAGKGNELVKTAYPMLEASSLNFIGNVEGKELFFGAADVVVTDGFTGNVLLKSSEAVAKLLTEKIKEAIKNGGPLTLLGGILIKPALSSIKRMLDPSEVGGAPLLGVDGLVFVGHGRSNAIAIKNAVRTAKQAVESHLLESIRSAIEQNL